jgi:hypothetical protein
VRAQAAFAEAAGSRGGRLCGVGIVIGAARLSPFRAARARRSRLHRRNGPEGCASVLARASHIRKRKVVTYGAVRYDLESNAVGTKTSEFNCYQSSHFLH